MPDPDIAPASGNLRAAWGPPSPLAAVRFEGEVHGPGGKPPVHRVAVPPRVADAREAAWSLGLSDDACDPAVQS